MEIEIDLEKIGQAAKLKTDENSSFKNYLENQDGNNIDVVVQQLNNEITPKISCVDCGNCCNKLRPAASYETLKNFVRDEDMDDFMYAENFSCMHLKDKKCSVYLDRPDECRSFPYMDRGKFITRIQGILTNYAICPIVFNIFEQLKRELAWEHK